MAEPAQPFRLCVDLNVWMAWVLSRAKGRRDTAAHVIADAIQHGGSALGAIQLVISHVMLSRLTDAMVREGFSSERAHRNARLIAMLATLGPSQQAPHLVLGGGVAPTRDSIGPRYDPYDHALVPVATDREDGRVLDTAIAGRADALVTSNLADFRDHHDEVVIGGRVYIRRTADHRLIVIRTQEMAAWLRTGLAPDGLR